VYEYDVRYPDGRVELNVDAYTVLQGATHPAEAHSTLRAAEDACPKVGTGSWVKPAQPELIEEVHKRAAEAPREPEPPRTFGHVLWNDPREVLWHVSRALFELFFGAHLAVDGESILIRLLGVALFAAGLLHVMSYVLSFMPLVLEGDRWRSTWPRRIAWVLLKYAWLAAVTGWGIAQLVMKI
jgi:hypothetical protein